MYNKEKIKNLLEKLFKEKEQELEVYKNEKSKG
jgi:hypothetical protein